MARAFPRKARPAPHLRRPRTCKAHGAGGGAEGPVHSGDRVADEPAQHAVVQAQAAARILRHQLAQKVPAGDGGVSAARHAGTARGTHTEGAAYLCLNRTMASAPDAGGRRD